ncbi:hypothetical protein [Prescottella subtropica]|uniref:hypothetical protein n=1 Tax=Prescottella subtropica TaxID=2545757 RepID=UPI0010F9549D|nr:hypothetical protein [Prescottella subtropica]
MPANDGVRSAGNWRTGGLFLLTGAAAVVAGGLLAAVTASAPTEHAVWASAYLVLVAGVCQIVVGGVTALLADRFGGVLAAAWIVFTSANAAVIGGTVTETTPVLWVGALLLLASLVLLLVAVRGVRGGVLLWGYRAVLIVLAVSTPIGLLLERR